MRFFSSLLFLALLGANQASAGFFDFLGRHDVQVIINTDVTPEGQALRTPTKDDPVYYQPVNVGYRDLGGIIAGDKVPKQADMIKLLLVALAKQGYVPANKEHRPTQVVLFMWGTMYVDQLHNVFNPDMPPTQINRTQLLKFLGGEKLGLMPEDSMDLMSSVPGLSYKGANAEMIKDAAQDDLYVAVLASYDLVNPDPHKPKLLWKTKIGCPALGLVMDQTLPAMLAIATPHIGRETTTPVWINASEKFKAEVKVGTTTVKEFIAADKVQVIDSSGIKPAKR
jgi:hypothetical protein